MSTRCQSRPTGPLQAPRKPHWEGGQNLITADECAIVKSIYFKGRSAQSSDCKPEGVNRAKNHRTGKDSSRPRKSGVASIQERPKSTHRAVRRHSRVGSEGVPAAAGTQSSTGGDEMCLVSPLSSAGGGGSRTFSPLPALNRGIVQGTGQRRAMEITARCSTST